MPRSYFLSELEAGAGVAAAGAGVLAAGAALLESDDDLLPFDEALVLSPEDFGLALP